MTKIRSQPTDLEALTAAAEAQHLERYVLRLYIAGTTPQSTRAIVNIRKICEEYLHDRYELEVVDISRDPRIAAREQVVATPTLTRELPLPLRRFIGDLSQTEKVLVGLDLHQKTPQ